jgi:hypothetical protein
MEGVVAPAPGIAVISLSPNLHSAYNEKQKLKNISDARFSGRDAVSMIGKRLAIMKPPYSCIIAMPFHNWFDGKQRGGAE